MQLKSKRPEWLATRLEGAVTPGLPDVLLTDEIGRFHLVELKNCRTSHVRLSAHQITFLIRQARQNASVWVLCRQNDTVFLFAGAQAIELAEGGLKKVSPVGRWEKPIDWDAIFTRLSEVNPIQ